MTMIEGTSIQQPSNDDVIVALRGQHIEPLYRSADGLHSYYQDFSGRDLVSAYLLGWQAGQRAGNSD